MEADVPCIVFAGRVPVRPLAVAATEDGADGMRMRKYQACS